MNAAPATLHDRRLRALGVAPLRLRTPAAPRADAARQATTGAPPAADASAPVIRRLALQPDAAELNDPAIRSMYAALTAAVGKAGLQPVRVCDVVDDPAAAVLVFGAAPAPEGVPDARVLRTDALAVLNADRDRKRLLWDRMRSLGTPGGT